MLNLLDKIIEETKDDNHLFARYGFKFYSNIENDAEKSLEYLKNKPNFKNSFQFIYMCGLIDHFYKDKRPMWVNDEKLSKPWFFLANENESNNESPNVNITYNYLPEMTERGIYAI